MRIGIDFGGTKIEGIVIGNDGVERNCTRIPTPQDDYKATLQAISSLVNRITKESNVPITTPIGIGILSIISPRTGLIKNANSVCLIGKMLDKGLE